MFWRINSLFFNRVLTNQLKHKKMKKSIKSITKSVLLSIIGVAVALLGILCCFTDASPNSGLPGEFGTTGILLGAIIIVVAEMFRTPTISKKACRGGMMFHLGAFATTAIALWKMGVICVYTDYYVVNNFGYYDEFSTEVNGVQPFIGLCILFAVRLLWQLIVIETPLFSRVSKWLAK